MFMFQHQSEKVNPERMKATYKVRCTFMVIICLLLMGGSPDALAQGREFGLKAGIMSAMTLNQGVPVGEPFSSGYGGFFIGRPLGSTFFTSLISGMEYLQNGYKADDNNFRKLHYLGIPLAVRIHFGPWRLQAGVNANFKFYERWMDDGTDILNIQNRSLWIDLPIQVGAGVRISDVIVEVKFLFGTLDVYEGNKNISLQLGLAYSF